MNLARSGLILTALLTLLATIGLAAADSFDFHGTTLYSANSTPINGANVSITLYNMSNNMAALTSYSALSNASGSFNVSNITIYSQEILYKPVIIHYNSSSNLFADYIGASLPEFPSGELVSAASSAITFYLRPAATINITAINASADPKLFSYQVKDKALGYPVAQEFTNMVTSKLFYVPKNRNYAVMIYPDQSFPVHQEVTITNLSSGYFHKEFNCTDAIHRLTGYVNISGVEGQAVLGNLTVVLFLLESGRMVYFGSNSALYNFTGNDTYIPATGFYNISVIGPVENSNMVALVIANGTYAGYKVVQARYSQAPSETNVTLRKLLGALSNISVQTSSGIATIPLNMMRFNIKNSTGAAITGNAFVSALVDYDNYGMTNFTFMADVSPDASGVFRLPLINETGVEKVEIFTQGNAPQKKKLSAANISSGQYNFTLKDAFNMEDPDGDALGGLFIDMIKNSTACNIPEYDEGTCSMFGAAEGVADVNPLAVVFSGAPLNFVMRNAAGITVIYSNVDLLASGPPDALFDSSARSTESSSAFEQAWKFGSTGPDIYDSVIMGVPYTEGNQYQNGLDEGAPISINIPYLYDDSWSVVWNSSRGDNIANISSATSGDLVDYQDYLGTAYAAYLNGTGVACDASDTNLSSGLCFINTTSNMLWFKIPHFSGIGPNIAGSRITASTTSAAPSGSPRGGAAAAARATETKTKVFDTVQANAVTRMVVSSALIHITEIEFTPRIKLGGVRLAVSNLASKPATVPEPEWEIYQYIEIAPTNLESKYLSGATVTFTVDKNWLANNGVSKENVLLLRYADGQWNELETSFIIEDSKKCTFEAKTPGFSYFAIAGKPSIAPPSPVTGGVTAPEGGEGAAGAAGQITPAELPAPSKSVWYAVIAVVVIAGAAIYWYYWKKRRPKQHRAEEKQS